MIVGAACIPSDGPRRRAPAIVESDHERADRAGNRFAGIATLRGTAREVAHRAVHSRGEPRVIRARRIGRAEAGDPGEVEPVPVRPRLQPVGELLHHHRSRTAQRA